MDGPKAQWMSNQQAQGSQEVFMEKKRDRIFIDHATS